MVGAREEREKSGKNSKKARSGDLGINENKKF